MFGLLVKVVGSSAIDWGLIPGELQLRQESGVGQEIANFCCLQVMNFVSKLAVLTQFWQKTDSASGAASHGDPHLDWHGDLRRDVPTVG